MINFFYCEVSALVSRSFLLWKRSFYKSFKTFLWSYLFTLLIYLRFYNWPLSSWILFLCLVSSWSAFKLLDYLISFTFVLIFFYYDLILYIPSLYTCFWLEFDKKLHFVNHDFFFCLFIQYKFFHFFFLLFWNWFVFFYVKYFFLPFVLFFNFLHFLGNDLIVVSIYLQSLEEILIIFFSLD